MAEREIETFCPANRKEWRKWLIKNHQAKDSVWLVCFKSKANKPTISWSESVEEALCFGWIDSIRKTLDGESFTQFFSKRKPKSGWSKINKAKVELLIEKGLMAQAGLDSINRAKENGSWVILDEIEELIIPDDLEQGFKSKPESKDFFLSLSKSVKKAMLQWITLAKRPETRQKRIVEIVELASLKQKPKQF